MLVAIVIIAGEDVQILMSTQTLSRAHITPTSIKIGGDILIVDGANPASIGRD
jgi:hypothetical protein